MTPDQRPDEASGGLLRSAFPPEWREQPLGHPAVEAWELENKVTLPEPYRTFVTEISNECSLGPAEDGLQPIGWLPSYWAGDEPRQPGELFPWRRRGSGRTTARSTARTPGVQNGTMTRVFEPHTSGRTFILNGTFPQKWN